MKELRGREKADVAIAGAGLSGLSIALLLSRAGLRVALLEARTAGRGISAWCMGAAYAADEADEKDERVVHTSARALQTVKELAEPFGLWKQTPLLKLDKDANTIQSHAACGVLQPDSYLRLLKQKAEENGAVVYEHSRVTAMEANEFHTEQGTLHAPYLVVATGYPILNIPGWYFLHLHQCEYDTVSLRGTEIAGVIVDEEEKTLLMPQRGGALLCCRTAAVGDRHNAKRAEQTLGQVQKKTGLYKEGQWMIGQEVHTPDHLPIIGAYGKKTPGLLVAAGYGGRGIVGSMMAAHGIASGILGLPGDGYDAYSPRRFDREWRTPVQTAYRYGRSLLFHAQAPRCPHMRCRLIYNPRTGLWECPCHGSCFDDIGHVENPPAVHEAILRSRK